MSVAAAVDCGTNSTRLLIVDGDRVLERTMHITGLGEGVDAVGDLRPEAIDRTLSRLRGFRELLDRHHVDRLRAVATSAARDAGNADALFVPAAEILGASLEVIDGTEEAELTYAGAVGGLDQADGPFLVVDIGGGSTEFAFGTRRCEASLSLEVGSVRMTERFLEHDPPWAEELSAVITLTQAHLDDLFRAIPAAVSAGTVVGVAGTITTVAAVEIGSASYDRDAIHHFRLTRDAVEDVFRTLATEPLVDRVHNPGLEPARAEVIVGGLCLLVAFMRTFGVDEILVSECDLLDGMVSDMAQR